MPVQTIKSPLLTALGVQHGFSTRHGGVSQGAYASLNLGDDLGDAACNVLENRRRFLASIFEKTITLQVPHQIHGADTFLASDTNNAAPMADGLISGDANLAVGIKTADCVPILISSDDGQWVAAVHAGWKGTALNILNRAIFQLTEQADIKTNALNVVIGPAISQQSFEVGPEVISAMVEALGISLKDCFNLGLFSVGIGDRNHVGLAKINAYLAKQAGILPQKLDLMLQNTAAPGSHFFSHRRDAGVTGRHLSVICPKRDR